jgi:cytochrome c peroxidase
VQAIVLLGSSGIAGFAQIPLPPDRPPEPGSLKTVAVPVPANLSQYIADIPTAIVLGKALFWDRQAGSDGLACASCHFHAGADNRIKNQLNPGMRNENGPPTSTTFNKTASNQNAKVGPPPGGGPNYTLKLADYPFHQLADPTDRNSAVLFDTDDVTSSQGVFLRDFGSDFPLLKRLFTCQTQPSFFSVKGTNVRQVELRNTPTVINAALNFRNFWDGRANNIFNGLNPFGLRDPTAGVDPNNSILVEDPSGKLVPERVAIPDSSLASQSMGPPLSNVEMSCSGRVFEDIATRLSLTPPLLLQHVDPTDSVLGPYAAPILGLNVKYSTLIQKAFNPRYWSSKKLYAGDPQMVRNFSLFWGLAIQMYESTLISNDSPFDQFKDGNPTALSAAALRGFENIFMGKGQCIFCHKGAEFTGAATSLQVSKLQGDIVEHMIMGDGTPALYDSGFYNIGVTPPVEDLGTGEVDAFGNPLSITRLAKIAAGSGSPTFLFVPLDQLNINTCSFQVGQCLPITNTFRDAVDGSFKVPTLRNVELTGPYFHNGSRATLEQVIEFYNRGGDRRGTLAADSTAYQSNPTNLDPVIQPLGLAPNEISDLVAFLKSLTDERVRWERAPFDHPGILVPNGHPGTETQVIPNPFTKTAFDDFLNIPAVGKAGRDPKKTLPVQSFDAGLK